MTMTPIHTEHVKREQSLCLTHIAKRPDARRFRVIIKRNAYDHQSTAAVSTWTPNGWTEVLRHENIATLRVAAFTYVTKDPTWVDAALADAEDLLRVADAVVL